MLPFQSNPAGASSFHSPLAAQESYVGGFQFGKNTITWGGQTVLRQNISSVYIYNIQRSFKVSNAGMLLMGLGVLASLFLGKLWPIIAIPCGLVLLYGLLERWKPRLFGVTIEMNSGSHKNIYSSDQQGIKRLYDAITVALESDEKIFHAHFGHGSIKIDNMQNIHNEINNSPNAKINYQSTDNSNSGNFSNRVNILSDELAKLGISSKDIEELKLILQSEQPDHQHRTPGKLTESWIGRMVEKHAGGMGKEISAGLLINLLSHFFGWS
ncbi:DUF6232 family protein [Chitinophaga sp. NPDC101104]|uniref:DUF6232 family protein n=1 Tax=Chitinophaga sp. NPDC101104 TaxID=3390561 RepID=UPI003CFD9D69